MIKNLILLFLFLFGIFITNYSFILGILFYFSIIFYFIKNQVFENFQVESCNYNIPVYVIDKKPIIINIEEYQLCEPLPHEGEFNIEEMEEEQELIPVEESTVIISGNSRDNSISFSHSFPEIKKKIHKGDKLQFSGDIMDREKTYTVSTTPTDSLINLEETVPDFVMKKGTFIILFPSINENLSSIIFDKDVMTHNINEIDKANSEDDILISGIEKSRDKINNYHNVIVALRESIFAKEKQIDNNLTLISKNKNTINNRSDYINFLKFAVDEGLQLDSNYSKSFSKKYNNLFHDNNKLKNNNDRLNLSILENRKKINEFNKLICKEQYLLEKIISKFPKHNMIKFMNNLSIDIQNKNFYKFVNGCKVPIPPKFSNKKKCLPRKL